MRKLRTRNFLIGISTAVAGVAVVRSMRNNNNRRKVKKAVNKAFDTVSDTVQGMR